MLLFKPWRKRSDVLGSFKTYEEAFNDQCCIDDTLKKYEEHLASFCNIRNRFDQQINDEEKKQNEILEDLAPEHVRFSTQLLNEVAEEFNAIQHTERQPFIQLFQSLDADQ